LRHNHDETNTQEIYRKKKRRKTKTWGTIHGLMDGWMRKKKSMNGTCETSDFCDRFLGRQLCVLLVIRNLENLKSAKRKKKTVVSL